MIKSISLLLFLVWAVNPCLGQRKDIKKIRKTFEGYKAAILKDKPEESIQFVDGKTMEYYGYLIDRIKHGDSVLLNKMPLSDRFLVLQMRHTVDKKELLKMDGEAFFIFNIREGLIGKNSVLNKTVGVVEIDGNSATAHLLENKAETPARRYFQKEGETWRINMTVNSEKDSATLKELQAKNNVSENEFLFQLLQMTTGTRPGVEIWQF